MIPSWLRETGPFDLVVIPVFTAAILGLGFRWGLDPVGLVAFAVLYVAVCLAVLRHDVAEKRLHELHAPAYSDEEGGDA